MSYGANLKVTSVIIDPYNFSFTSDLPGLYLTNTQGNSTHFILKQGQGITITATATNASPCGVVGRYVFVYPRSGYRMAFVPNPATDEVLVQPEAAPDAATPSARAATASPAPSAGIAMVRVYDSYGRLRLEQPGHGEATLRLRVHMLPAGL